MITSVRGALTVRELDRVTIEVGGVGLDIAVSMQTLAKLPQVGSEVALHTYLNVREDALQLFGFRSVEERQAFLLCLSVQQVGPKLAMSILSAIDAEGLAHAVRDGDHARLRKIPGVGQKTAERLVLELKDKLDRARPPGASSAKPGGPTGPAATVAAALVNLGYKAAEAERAAKEAVSAGDQAGESDVSALLTRALRALAE